MLFVIISSIRMENYQRWLVEHANINSIQLVFRNGFIVATKAIAPYARVNFYDKEIIIIFKFLHD